MNTLRRMLIFLCTGWVLGLSVAGQIPCDLLIRSGKILDGTGNSWYNADIAVRSGKIVAIGRSLQVSPSRTINAKGLIVAPGFIDVHTHIEGDERKNPRAENFIFDGDTTVVTGNCGFSDAHIGGYLRMIDSLKTSINVATLVGHNDIRKEVMGRANRQATPAEQKQMEKLVEDAMKEGAVGFSTGLIYIPGSYAQTEEIVKLASIAAKYNGLYATHMRSEGDQVKEAIQEALTVGREAGIPVEISHFKISGQHNWGKSNETLAMVRQAREGGLEVTIDQYPYTASSTSLSTLLPDEILSDSQDSIRARLQRPETKNQVARFMVERLRKRKLKHFSYVVVAAYSADSSLNGKSIEEINRQMGRRHKAKQEALTILDMVMKGGASAVFHGMGEEDLRRIMQYPFNMFASDGSIRVLGAGMPHPRSYGTNTRVLGKYVREEKLISLEEAVRRMTSLPAQTCKLRDRGLLKEGMAADIIIFDPAEITDLSTYKTPHQLSKGVHYVLVNGVLTMDQAKHTGARAGRALYGPGTENKSAPTSFNRK